MQIDDLIAFRRKDDRNATHDSPHAFNEVIYKSKSNQDYCVILSKVFRKKYLKAHSFFYILTIILSVVSLTSLAKQGNSIFYPTIHI